MSYFVNDTLQKKIQRGQVFWCIAVDTNQFQVSPDGSTNSISFAVETGANECYVNFEALAETTTGISIHEDVTSFVSTASKDIENMKRSDTTTVMNTTVDLISSWIGGTSEFGLTAVPNGKFPQNTPLNLESGPLLKPSTIYVYDLVNVGVANIR